MTTNCSFKRWSRSIFSSKTNLQISRHHQAKKYELHKGYVDENDYEIGKWAVCDTRRSLGQLQQYLFDAFLRVRIPVVRVSPFDFIVDEENFSDLFKRLEFLLARGFVPMLHGDVLLDKKKHWRIFSGDDLLLKLSEYFRPRLCVFLTSVNGILRADGTVIEQFYVDQTEFDSLENSSNNIDVTGSMKNKMMICSDIVKKLPACQVFILHAASENAKKLLINSIEQISTSFFPGSTRIMMKKKDE